MFPLSQLWMLTPSMRRGEPLHLAHWSLSCYETSFDQVNTYTQHSECLKMSFRRIDGPERHLGGRWGEASDAARCLHCIGKFKTGHAVSLVRSSVQPAS